MAKVFGIHRIALQPGVPLAEFEAFLQRATPSVAPWPGVTARALIADRGSDQGQLLFMLEFDDVATRDRYFSIENTPSAGAEQLAGMTNFIAEWQQYATFPSQVVPWTDYVAIGGY